MKRRDSQDQGKPSRARALAALSLAAPPALAVALAACAGPPLTSPIEGEPVCADFDVGAAHTKMAGGLRFPVLLTIKRGSTQVFKTTILGRRTEKDLPSRILLSDDDETFSVEWAQCENERAPRAAEIGGRDSKQAAKYECGTAKAYKTDQLTTKKGDAKSHVLTFPAPPDAACLKGVAAAEAPDAGAPDAAAESDAGDAADAAADAEAASADGGATDAGAASTAGGADAGPPADGGASDGGASKSK